MARLDYEVMGHAFAIHQELGRLCDELVYQSEMATRLAEAGLGPTRREVPVTVTFQAFTKVYELDLTVADRGIYELKVASRLTAAHEAQLLNYLLLINVTRGKLVNFRPASVETCFVNTSLNLEQRRRFRVTTRRWQGTSEFEALLVELLRDWGTGLENPLYTQAITHLLGGEAKVIQPVPMRSHGRMIGTHRFHLYASDTAFMLTNFTRRVASHEAHFQRLINLTPLRQLWWVNIALHEVAFTTLTRQSFSSL